MELLEKFFQAVLEQSSNVTELFSRVGLKVFLNISSRHLWSQLAQPVFIRLSLK